MIPSGGARTEVVIVDHYGPARKRSTDRLSRPTSWTPSLELTVEDAKERLRMADEWLASNKRLNKDLLRSRQQWRDKLAAAVLAAEQGEVYAARAEMQRTHPDRGGDPEAFQKARQRLRDAQAEG
jgi:hypothetical protein